MAAQGETMPRRALALRYGARGALGVLGMGTALVTLGALVLNTQVGRDVVAGQISALAFANGMTIHIGRIEGSLFGAMRITGLDLGDTRGVFFHADRVDLDARPLAYLGGHVDVRALHVPDARLIRRPQWRPTPPSNSPLLPDLDVDVNNLAVDRLDVAPAFTGKHHILAMQGEAHIANRRALIVAHARAVAGPQIAGGDRLDVKLDAQPDTNRLDIDLAASAPADGMVAALTGEAQARSLRLAGNGTWAAWDGQLAATTGGKPLADLVINARRGTFAVKGTTHPDVVLKGENSAVFQPETHVDATATFNQRRMDVNATLGNDNAVVRAQGRVDLGNNTMQDMRIALRVMRPKVLAKNLYGDDVSGDATLNGSFAAPDVRYGLRARMLGFGATRFDGLVVSGGASLAKDHWRLPVSGSAAAITGVSTSVAPLLRNLKFNGDFGYGNGRLLSDNIHILSAGIDARAVVIADLPKAVYTGTLNGRINGYRVESVGVFNLASNIGLKTASGGAFRLGGHVTARSTRLFNDGVASFLGGNAVISADVGYGTDGLATLDHLVVAAPAFRMTGGAGRYDAAGRISFAGTGASDRYGPFRLNARGTVAAPVVHLDAARPGLGVGLADLAVDVTGRDGTYQVKGKGQSDYGPLVADVALRTGHGPLAVAIHPATRVAGIGLSGDLVQQGAGPFAGALSLDGAGLKGRADLSAMGASQRAVVDLVGQNVVLPGKVGVSAGRVLVKGDIVLAQTPQVNADVQMAGVHQGDFYLSLLRANVAYRDGAGVAKVLAEGRNRYPFHLAAQGQLSRDLWRVAVNSRVNGVAVNTRAPMEIVPGKGEYTLRPAMLSVNAGTLAIEGHYGARTTFRSRLDGVDLAAVNAFVPHLGLGGKASGDVDMSLNGADAMPVVDARLKLAGFSRTGLAAVSTPVDIALALNSSQGNASIKAAILRGGTSIGQLQANATPAGPVAGTWSNRLMAAPITGGLRYNGPADVLTSLAALADQSVTGPIGVAADFGGTVRAPNIHGLIRADKLVYDNASYGTRLTDMAVRGTFTNERLNVESLNARAGNGTVKASGFVSLNADQGYPIQLGITMDRAQVANGQDLSAKATGDIKVTNEAGKGATVSGTIDLPETHYRIVRESRATVPTLTGIRRKPITAPERISGASEKVAALPANWALDLRVRADNQIFVTGMGLDSEWSANMRVGGTSSAPAVTGNIRLVRGTLSFAGHAFDIDSGTISMNGGDMTDPAINISASGDVGDTAITIAITGTGNNPQITLSSDPALPQDELMARILFGGPVGSLTTLQAVQLASSLNSLRGGRGGLNPLGTLQSATAISRLRVLGADATTGRETALAAGKYITNNIYVEIITDTRGYTATQLEISLTKALSIISQAGQFGGTGATVRYRKRY